MADDELAKEEARILASLEGAKKHAQKNVFGAKKPPLGGAGATAPSSSSSSSTNVTPVQSSGGLNRPSGTMPAWKQQQLEKERREKEKLEEEERKRKEKAKMERGVVEESVVTLGGAPQYQSVHVEVQTEGRGVSGGEIVEESVAKEVDIEEQMRLEEERLLNKVKNTAPLPSRNSQVHTQTTTNLTLGKKVKVTWIDRRTEKPIQTFDWYCNQDRLPLKAIMHEWKIRNVYWADLEQPIGVLPDGFSDMTFEGISHIKIFADRV